MHIANITSASLDELNEPIDLGQTPADIAVLSFSESDLIAISKAYGRLTSNDRSKDGSGCDQASQPTMRLAALRNLRHPMSVDLWIDAVASHARIVVVRLLGGYDYWPYGADRLSDIARKNNIKLALLPGECRVRDEKLEALSTMDADALDELLACFREGGGQNMEILLERLAALNGTISDTVIPAAKPVPRMGFYQPGSGVVSLDAFSSVPEGQATPIATLPIIFYRSILLADDTAPIDALAAALAARDILAVPVFVPTLKDPDVCLFLETMAGALKPDMLLTTTAFAAGLGHGFDNDDGGADRSIFEKIGVPVFQAIIATTRREAWDESESGLGSADLAMNVVLPELDGRILAGAISFKDFSDTCVSDTSVSDTSVTGANLPSRTSGELNGSLMADIDGPLQYRGQINRPEPSRIENMAARVQGMIALQSTPPPERNLLIIMPDYPGADGRTGYAVGLDVPQSVLAMFNMLGEAGYDVGENIPSESRHLMGLLRTPKPALDGGVWPLAFERLPEEAREAVSGAWGAPGAEAYSFRYVTFGNITVALAPDRGRTEDRRADYHDPTIPPGHGLLAFGHWARHRLNSHAIVHCGAHGTLEWLPGKAVALSKNCFPEIVTSSLPVIYPFIVSNPGEAAQAKRRIAALTLGHMPPPIIGAGLTAEQIELERLVDEFVQADGLDNRRRDRLGELILQKAEETGLDKIAGVEAGAEKGSALKKIDGWLCDLKDFAIKDGQHVFSEIEPGCEDPLRLKSAQSEGENFLRALDGRFVPSGPSGSPMRGRRDVYPTGRNLFTIDPRTMPTITAFEMGKVAADELLRFYMQEHGEAPHALVLDLWGSASLRTGGEEIAQGLALMGCKPQWDYHTGRVTGIEVLPLAQLGRSRVDVTWRISGLFRDMFPDQISLMNAAMEAVSKRREDDDENPLAADVRETGAVPHRIFGSAPGTYGAGSETLLETGKWQDRAEIGDAYLAASSHAFSGGGTAPAHVTGGFAERVKNSDLLLHTGDDPGRDMLEGSSDVAFMGGFAAALARLETRADIVTLDTTDPDKPRARSLVDSVARIVHARAINARYIDGQMRHGPRGASDFAETVDRLIGFAETTEAIPEHLIEAVYTAYVVDERVREFILRENPDAAKSIARRFEAARRRGLWHPRRNSVDVELMDLTENAEGREVIS